MINKCVIKQYLIDKKLELICTAAGIAGIITIGLNSNWWLVIGLLLLLWANNIDRFLMLKDQLKRLGLL